MKGSASAYHSLTPDENLALKNACKINKLVSEVNTCFDILPIKMFRHPNSSNISHSLNYSIERS